MTQQCGESMRWCMAIGLIAVTWVGCSGSHAPSTADGGADAAQEAGREGGLEGGSECPPIFEPIACYLPQRVDGVDCCEPGGVAECVDGVYVCPSGTRMGRCGEDVPACGAGGGGCPEVPTPPCYRVYPDRGCCDAAQERPMVCVGSSWQCPEGYATEEVCRGGGSGPPAPFGCASIGSPGACLQRDDCVPTYDDACCPSCTPGPCTACVIAAYRFGRCETRRSACAPGAGPSCGTLSAWACGDARPDCSGAVPSGTEGCSVPGCVLAVPARDADCPRGACRNTCEPLTPASCGPALCDRIPPVCPEGKVPLVVDGCYPSPPRCIDAALCGSGGMSGTLNGFCGV